MCIRDRTKLYDFQANGRQPCDNITAGDIVAFSGLPDVTIGNTLCCPSNVEPVSYTHLVQADGRAVINGSDAHIAGHDGLADGAQQRCV